MKIGKRILSVLLVLVMIFGTISVTAMAADSTETTTPAPVVSATEEKALNETCVGYTFTYGTYPQTNVTEEMGDTLTEAAPSTDSWISYKYYASSKQSDYMKYYDLSYNDEMYRGVYFSAYRPTDPSKKSAAANTEQIANGYTAQIVYWFKYEPVSWHVLDPEKGYVICDTILDSQAFFVKSKYDSDSNAYYTDSTLTFFANNWAYSDIRTWLNDTFFNTAFSKTEQEGIVNTKIKNSAFSTSYKEYDAADTKDMIMLPSYADVQNDEYGMSDSQSRKAAGSDYAKSQGLYVSTSYSINDNYTSYYRLRTAGSSSGKSTGVNPNGSFGNSWSLGDINDGIRPAMYLNTDTKITHAHNFVEENTADAYIRTPLSCTEQATYYYKCVTCEAHGDDYFSYGDPFGHTFSSFKNGFLNKCNTCGKAVDSISTGDHVLCGSYPQTKVDDTLANTLTSKAPATSKWNSYGYYIDSKTSDFMKYYDLTYNGEKYRGVYFTNYRPYETYSSSSTYYSNQDDNGYKIKTVYWFKYDPVSWRILDPKTGYAISEGILDARQYYHTYENRTVNKNTVYPNNWEYSDIRTWLNDSFYNTVFSATDKTLIVKTTINTPAASSSRGEYFDVGDTQDNVYLPAYKDMKKTSYGFSSSYSDYDNARKASGSDYAKAQGLYDAEAHSDYFMRSAGYYNDQISYVSDDGYLSSYGTNVYYTNNGIRPVLCFKPAAFCVKVSKVSLAYSKTPYDGTYKKPTVTVKDSAGNTLKKDTDYTVTYSKNKSIGTATVKVVFKGDYTGSETKTFKIYLKTPSSVKTTSVTTSSIKLSWAKVSGAAKYVVSYSKDGKTWKTKTVSSNSTTLSSLSSGTSYKVKIKAVTSSGKTSSEYSTVKTFSTKCVTPTITVTSPSKGKVKISWKKVTGATSYTVYYASSKNGTYKKISTVKTLSLTDSGYTKGSTRYFKVVANRTVSGTSYSATSAAKSVKIK